MLERLQLYQRIMSVNLIVKTEIKAAITLLASHLTSPPLTYSITKHSRSLVWNEYFKDLKGKKLQLLKQLSSSNKDKGNIQYNHFHSIHIYLSPITI